MKDVQDRGGPTPSRRRFVPGHGGGLRVGLVALIVLLASSMGFAHIVMGTKSLHLRVAEADLIVRARVIDPDFVFISEDGRTRRRLVEIEILEDLKGIAGSERIRFAQDGHAVAQYRVGQQAIFFLKPISKSRELRAIAVPGGPTHVSGQEHDEEFLLGGPYGPVFLSATRDLTASESAEIASERVALIRRATLDLLTSGDAQLGASALSSLVLAPHAALVTRADLPRIEKFLSNREVSIGLRAGLIAELERRGLLDGSAHWLALLQTASPQEMPVAIRAVGFHQSQAVNAILLTMLSDPNSKPEVAAECAIALGTPGNVAMVGALAEALTNGTPRVRNAAIRGLGQIGRPEARKALENAAERHPDPGTRRRARAKLRSGEALSARPAAP